EALAARRIDVAFEVLPDGRRVTFWARGMEPRRLEAVRNAIRSAGFQAEWGEPAAGRARRSAGGAAPGEIDRRRSKMAVIGIDTAGRLGGVGVVSAGRLLGATVLGVEEGHSQNLLPALESLMERLDLTPAAVDGIAVAIGPGSFTGLRIGVAVAKALGYAWGVPVKGVSTLLATAWPLAGVPGVICASLDARKEHVFSATYAGERLGELARGAVGGALEAGERHDSAVSPAGRGPEPGGAPAGGFASGGAAPLLPAEAVIDPEERRSIE